MERCLDRYSLNLGSVQFWHAEVCNNFHMHPNAEDSLSLLTIWILSSHQPLYQWPWNWDVNYSMHAQLLMIQMVCCSLCLQDALFTHLDLSPWLAVVNGPATTTNDLVTSRLLQLIFCTTKKSICIDYLKVSITNKYKNKFF